MYQALIFFAIIFGSFGSYAQDVFESARAGDTIALRAAFDMNPDTLNSKNEHGFTPIILATYRNQFETVKWLIRNGADNSLNSPEGIALHGACYKGNLEIATFLIDNGSDINSIGGRGASPLIYAVMSENIELVRMLLERGADKNIRDDSGFTAKEYAERMKAKEITELF